MRLQQNSDPTGSQPRSESGVPDPLVVERGRAAAALVERLLAELVGRIYSPRIKLLDIWQVCEATGLGRSTILRMVEQGTFPKPQLNIGKQMWRESRLIAWADAHDPN